MAKTDAEKLKELQERKKRAEGLKLDTATLKGAKTKGDTLKTETKKETD
jgi:hypothetical protein